MGKKYMAPKDLQENVIYQFEVPWDNYTRRGPRPNPNKTDENFAPDYQWELKLKKASILSAPDPATGETQEVPMAAPSSNQGPIEIGEAGVIWTASEIWHRQALEHRMHKGAVINICVKKAETSGGRSYMQAGIELVEDNGQYPINGNCKTFEGVTSGPPVLCEDPIWIEMQSKMGVGPAAQVPNGNGAQGTAEVNGVAAAQPAPAQPVNGDRINNDAAIIVQAFETVDQALNHPSISPILNARDHKISAEEFFGFVRGVCAALGQNRASHQVTNPSFTIPPNTDTYPELLDSPFGSETEQTFEQAEAAIMSEN